MSRVLVTGASGFLGGALVSELSKRGSGVVATSRLDQPQAPEFAGITRRVWACDQPDAARVLLEILRAEEVDAVIHLAAVARPAVATADPARALAVNVGGTASLLEAIRLTEGQVRTLIASTAGIPLTDPRRWLPYFASKRAAEELAISYWRTYGEAVSVARLATVYGPGSERGAARLIPGVIKDLRRGLPPRVRDPDALVDLLHVDDAVCGLLAALEQAGIDGFDIATGQLLRAVDVARFLEDLMTGNEGACPQPVAVATDLVRPREWSPAVPLRTGLARMIELCGPRQDGPAAIRASAARPAGSSRERSASLRRGSKPDREFGGFYAGLRVLVTGSTGFKGSWLALWLTMLGADVTGFGLAPARDRPSHFEIVGLDGRIRQVYGDVTDQRATLAVLRECEPDVIFHLAAQPLVQESLRRPAGTFLANTIGTVNILDCARIASSVRSIVCVTSDKCYQNQEWVWGYRETDPLGGDDPYSASKAAAELAIAAFRATVYPASGAGHVCIASARAGNVIGGGDWAAGRLVPDVVRWATGSEPKLVLRNPAATRPWQHVLEPLSGYLWLACREPGGDDSCRCEAWNFGPSELTGPRAQEVAVRIAAGLGRPLGTSDIAVDQAGPRETTTLRLDSRKAAERLLWRATWTVDEAIDASASWYSEYYSGATDGMVRSSQEQIREYAQVARQRGLRWAEDLR